jgi:hypothetical protein
MAAAIPALLLLTETALHLTGKTAFRSWACYAYILGTFNFIVSLIAARAAFKYSFTGFVAVMASTGAGRMAVLLAAVFMVSRHRPEAAMVFSAFLIGIFFAYLALEIVIFITQIRNK